MKIIISDDRLGVFHWETPPSVDKSMQRLTDALRKEMGLSDEDLAEAERAYVEHIENYLCGFLHIVVRADMLSGQVRLMVDEAIDTGLMQISLEVVEIAGCALETWGKD